MIILNLVKDRRIYNYVFLNFITCYEYVTVELHINYGDDTFFIYNNFFNVKL